jgi:hypothetical protein
MHSSKIQVAPQQLGLGLNGTSRTVGIGPVGAEQLTSRRKQAKHNQTLGMHMLLQHSLMCTHR